MTTRKPLIVAAGQIEQIQSGDYVSANCLGSGSPSASTYLSGANTWDTLPGGGGSYLPLTGGTMTGNQILANGVYLQGTLSSSGVHNLIGTTGSNTIEISSGPYTTRLLGTIIDGEGNAFLTSPYQHYGYYTMSATQTSNLAANNHIQFDTNNAVSGLNNIQTGSGQANGILTLTTGTYKLTGNARILYTGATGSANIQFRDETNSSFFGTLVTSMNSANTGFTAPSFGLTSIVTVSGSKNISLAIQYSVAPSTIASGFAWMMVEQIG